MFKLLICPNCQTTLKTDFGYETCSKCGTVVFIDLDGTVVPHDPNSSIALEVEAEGDIIAGEAISHDDADDIQETEDITGHEFGFSNEEIGNLSVSKPIEDEEYNADPLSGFEDLEDPLAESVEDLEAHEPNGIADSFEEFDLEEETLEAEADNTSEEYQTEDEVEEETAEDDLDEGDGTGNEYVVTTADDFLEEMQMFGEIDSDKFKESIYFFDIEIAGIDSKDIRESLMVALEDSKLNLTIENLNRQIVDGVLTLKSVSAVKAHVAIQRISHLPCEISWTLMEVQDLQSDTLGFEDSNAELATEDHEESSDEFDEFA